MTAEQKISALILRVIRDHGPGADLDLCTRIEKKIKFFRAFSPHALIDFYLQNIWQWNLKKVALCDVRDLTRFDELTKEWSAQMLTPTEQEVERRQSFDHPGRPITALNIRDKLGIDLTFREDLLRDIFTDVAASLLSMPCVTVHSSADDAPTKVSVPAVPQIVSKLANLEPLKADQVAKVVIDWVDTFIDEIEKKNQAEQIQDLSLAVIDDMEKECPADGIIKTPVTTKADGVERELKLSGSEQIEPEPIEAARFEVYQVNIERHRCPEESESEDAGRRLIDVVVHFRDADTGNNPKAAMFRITDAWVKRVVQVRPAIGNCMINEFQMRSKERGSKTEWKAKAPVKFNSIENMQVVICTSKGKPLSTRTEKQVIEVDPA